MSSVRIPVTGGPHSETTGSRDQAAGDTERHSHVVGTVLMPPETPTGFLTFIPATATPARSTRSSPNTPSIRGWRCSPTTCAALPARGQASEHARLRMRDWMQEDANAVADWANREYPELPKLAIGHSLGGHALLLGNANAGLHGIITVGTALAALQDINPRSERLRVGLILRALGPLISPLVGYAPGKASATVRTSRSLRPSRIGSLGADVRVLLRRSEPRRHRADSPPHTRAQRSGDDDNWALSSPDRRARRSCPPRRGAATHL